MTYIKNHFFIRMTLIYCGIIIIALGSSVYFIIRDWANETMDARFRYETEVLHKIHRHQDTEFEAINSMIRGLYLNTNYNSITQLISPYSNSSFTAKQVDEMILATMQNVTLTNDTIVDTILLDATEEKVYFYTDEKGRDRSTGYNFFEEEDSLFHKATRSKQLIYAPVTPYILKEAPTADLPVLSLFMNMYDIDVISDNRRTGVMILNLNLEKLIGPYKEEIDELWGEIFVLLGDETIYSSSGNTYIEGAYEGMQEILQNRSASALTDIRYIYVIDKKTVYQRVIASLTPVFQIISVSLGLAVLAGFLFSKVFAARIQHLIDQLKQVEGKGLKTRIEVKQPDEIGYLEQSFNDMYEQLDAYVENVYVSDLKRKNAEIQVLQSQINPHYVLNTLESIRMVAQMQQPEMAAQMISLFGNMFRWNMKMNELHVPLEEELDYIGSYIELQKLRFGDDIHFETHRDDVEEGITVPKLILQPLIENAIYHGGISARRVLGIELNLTTTTPDAVTIEVKDNGYGIDEERLAQVVASLAVTNEGDNQYAIGLRNVHQRLQLLYGEGYGLSIDSRDGEGTSVTIRLPKEGTRTNV